MSRPDAVDAGSVVWVKTGLQHEEPATVLQVDCEWSEVVGVGSSNRRSNRNRNRNDGESEDGSDSDNDSNSENENEMEVLDGISTRVRHRKDGVLVRYNVSLAQEIVAPSRLRLLESSSSSNHSSMQMQKQKQQQQQMLRRNPRRQTHNQTQKNQTAQNQTQQEQKQMGLNRQVVTPSPTAAAASTAAATTATVTCSLEGESQQRQRQQQQRKKCAVTPSPTPAWAQTDDNNKSNNESDSDNEKDSKKPAAKRKRRETDLEPDADADAEIATATSTDRGDGHSNSNSHGPHKLSKTKSHEESEAQESQSQSKLTLHPTLAAASASTKATTNSSDEQDKNKNLDNDSDDESSLDVPISSLRSSSPHFSKNTNINTQSTSTPTSTAKSTAKAKAKFKFALLDSDNDNQHNNNNNNNNMNNAQEGNFDEGSSDDNSSSNSNTHDKPFQVEYAPSGRATCRRCDEVIQKGQLRVSHVPLFRGKPGFRIYRHLHCAQFTENITKMEQVGGWNRLKPNDRQLLMDRLQTSKQELQQEQQELEPDELVPVTFQGEIRSVPPGLVASLLPFQVEGASWMYHQEVHVPDMRGGILADEMGMGKTLQTIVTILDNKPILQHSKRGIKHPPSSPDLDARLREEALWEACHKDWHHEMDMNNIPKKMRPKPTVAAARAGTLVICPVIALSQWKSEIEKFTAANALTVAVYHGPNRASELPLHLMLKYDVILTTYQVLESDFRKMISPNKVSCPNCGNKFKIDKLRIHLKYFCGEAARRTEAQSRQRRTADRPSSGDGDGGNGSSTKGKNKGKDNNQKPPMTKSFSEKSQSKAKQTSRKIILKSNGDCESESDLSAQVADEQSDEEVLESSPNAATGRRRPSRSAAVVASKRMSSSVKEWGAGLVSKAKTKHKNDDDDDDDDESSFGSASDDDDDDDLDSDPSDKRSNGKRKQSPAQSRKKRPATQIASSPSEESESEALERARAKQRQALENLKKGKKKNELDKKKAKDSKSKNGSKSKKAKKDDKKDGKGKKKKFNDSSDDDDDDDDSDDDSDNDPMAAIDMGALLDEAMAGSRFSPLHAFCWWRVVLDEAHFIKSRSSQTSAAAFALSSIHRWCLSGTPLQNRVGELYSLVRFLRIDPMAHYFCRMKGCACKSIHYRMQNGKCQDCGHRTFCHFSHFNKHVLNPIQRDGYSGDGRRAMFKLKNEVLDKALLRRTKETRAEDMNLPPRIVTIRTIRLHPVEEDFYNALYMQTRSSFDDYVAEGTLLNNYAHIFDLLTRMRQAVDHPYLIVYSKKEMEKGAGRSSAPVANGTTDCDICHEPPTERVLSSCCGAGFCRSCVIEYLGGAGGENTPCPSCRAPFTIDLNQASSDDAPVGDGTLTFASSEKGSASDNTAMPSLKELSHVPTGSILRRINLAEFATSTKIEVLIQELIEMRKNRPGSKALVFSQFVNMLDLIRWRLHSDPCLADMGIGVRIIHGGMDAKSRDAVLKEFREDTRVRVLLMSLKAGGVALNLTVASEVFLVDNWWNPAAEMQAIDRTHRLGQYRPIRAVRFIAEGTVEERVLQLQEKKRLVFDGTVGRDAGSLKMLTVTDMKALFA